MTSILPTSLFSGNYYDVPTTSSTASTSSTSSKAGTISGLSASQTVAELLFQAQASTDVSANDSGFDTVSLSAGAQNYISQSVGVSDPNSTFVLSNAQSQKLTAILQKYADAPETQTTFDQIQADLKTAGISPDQLAAQDVQNGSSPALEIAQLLNGETANPPSFTSEQTKASNYINQVYSQFQKIVTQDQASQSQSVSTTA